jgi:hypothetical protein
MKYNRLLILFLILLALWSSACNLTNMLQPTATPTPSPTLRSTDTPIPTQTVTITTTTTPTETIHPTVTLHPTITQSSTSSAGSISGVLWHDTCKFTGGEGGELVVLGQGCVQWGAAAGEFGPNQVYDSFESGWGGVTLHIGVGTCPSKGFGTAVTDAYGNYKFYVLPPGPYCISYSPITDGNDSILIPGDATFPARGAAGYSRTINLGPGENKTGVQFGYAWQFYN